MTRTDLEEAALTRYGLGTADTAGLFPTAVMTDLVNEAHRWLAEETLCYRETQTYSVTAGTAEVPLDDDVLDIVPRTVRLKSGGAWRELHRREESELRSGFGPVERDQRGRPRYYTLLRGATAGQHRILQLWPVPESTLASALKLDAYTYPAELGAAEEPALQPGQHSRLIAPTCWRMAELERARGRGDAPVEYWVGRALEDAAAVKRTIQRFRRGGTRRVHQRHYYW